MKNDQPYHIPVLIDEVLEYLALKPNGVYVDATFGGGGHTRAILQAEPTATVIGMDWDVNALEMNGERLQEQFPGRLQLVWGNFAQIEKKLKPLGLKQIDGILADFGTSQYQIKQRPGFSFSVDTPLDMRMSSAHHKVTAAHILANCSEKELVYIFKEYGQEYKARAIAARIIEERKKRPLKTTKQLAQLIERVVPRRGKIHPATKVFQALRIAVNHELEQIRSFLPAALRLLAPGGRLVCISFHSLEDRPVKQFFREQVKAESSDYKLLTPKVIIASPEEIERNPSSRSAKLRAIARVQ